jgi:hypothetical protein
VAFFSIGISKTATPRRRISAACTRDSPHLDIDETRLHAVVAIEYLNK